MKGMGDDEYTDAIGRVMAWAAGLFVLAAIGLVALWKDDLVLIATFCVVGVLAASVAVFDAVRMHRETRRRRSGS